MRDARCSREKKHFMNFKYQLWSFLYRPQTNVHKTRSRNLPIALGSLSVVVSNNLLKMLKNVRWLQFKVFSFAAPFPERSRSAGLSTLELRIFILLVERVEGNFIPPFITAKLQPNKGKRSASLNKNVNAKHKGLQGTVIYVVINGWKRTDDHFEKNRNSWLLDAISVRHP